MNPGSVPNDPRRHVRFDIPEFNAQVAGAQGRSLNWSWGGVALALDPNGPSGWREGAHVAGTLRYGDALAPVPFEGDVCWVSNDGGAIGLRFTGLNRDLVHLVTDAVREIASGTTPNGEMGAPA